MNSWAQDTIRVGFGINLLKKVREKKKLLTNGSNLSKIQ